MKNTKEQNEKPKKKKKAGYIDNEAFLFLLILRKQLLKDLESLTDEKEISIQNKAIVKNRNEIGKMLIQIANGLSKRPNFINYPDDQKSEMISDAIFCMTKFMDRYDTSRTNPFAYFSQISWNAFLQSITNMKKRISTFVSAEYIDNYDGMGNNMTDSFDE